MRAAAYETSDAVTLLRAEHAVARLLAETTDLTDAYPRRGHDREGGDPVRVVVADDSVLLREGIVRLLEEAGFDVVAQAGDAEDLVRKVSAHKPDVAVVDIRMPPTNTDDGLRARRSSCAPSCPTPACSCCPSTSRRATRSTCWPRAATAWATC